MGQKPSHAIKSSKNQMFRVHGTRGLDLEASIDYGVQLIDHDRPYYGDPGHAPILGVDGIQTCCSL